MHRSSPLTIWLRSCGSVSAHDGGFTLAASMCVHSALWAAQITEIADARMALVLLQTGFVEHVSARKRGDVGDALMEWSLAIAAALTHRRCGQGVARGVGLDVEDAHMVVVGCGGDVPSACTPVILHTRSYVASSPPAQLPSPPAQAICLTP